MDKGLKFILCVVLLACMVFSFRFGYWLRREVSIDGCLDAGGAWNYERDWCERYLDPPSMKPSWNYPFR